eukprot:1669880-Ditylum_brightwellii.AAC.1
MTEVSKEVQQQFKEDEEAAMDDPWVNEVLVKKPPTAKAGQPNFTELDNPGDWSEFCYCPNFEKDGMYKGHKLPTGATPVPISNRKQMMNSWYFFTMAGKTTPTHQQDM